MKLVVCLIVLSLAFVVSSSSFIGETVSQAPKCQAGFEQAFSVLTTPFQSNRSTEPGRWTPVAWVEGLGSPLRGKRKWRRLRRWLHKLRRWYRRVQRWVLLRRQWQALMDGTAAAGWPVMDTPSCEPEQAVIPTAAGPGSKEAALTAQGLPEATTPSARRGPGRPREIPTEHVCCPHESCTSYGILGPHPKHDIVGHGTYTTVHGEKRQMYQCIVCGQPFSETAGTPFFKLKTPMKTVCIALHELAEGLGVRAVARIHGVEPDTVLDWLRKAGEHCERVSEYMMQELELSQVQLDELWTFVRKKQRMLSEWEKLHSEWGDTWIWIAFDPVHKLVIAVFIGDRTEEEAMGLLGCLRDRLIEDCLPLLTSDSLPHYVRAILRVFGVWIQPLRKGSRGPHPKPRQVPPRGLNYATVHKERNNGRVVSVTTRLVYGRLQDIEALLAPLEHTINTSFVERMNLTLRHLVSRLHRKTLCFSKKRAYLTVHLHLALAYYHFVRYHSGLRVRLPQPVPTRGNGSPKEWQQNTPAMASGLTDRAWTLKELLMFHVPAGAT